MYADVTILKGLVQKHSDQLKQINDKVTVLTARSMERNITITGLDGDVKEEKCKNNVLKFLRDKVNMKGRKNAMGDPYYINKQLPDKLVEKQKRIREQIKEQKEKDKNVPNQLKAKI